MNAIIRHAVLQLSLHDAAKRGDVQQLRRAIAAGANVNARHGDMTPLARACLHAPASSAERPLSPLHWATITQFDSHTDCVAALLQAGANPCATFGPNLTALHVAAERASVQAVQMICEAAHARVSTAQCGGRCHMCMCVLHL